MKQQYIEEIRRACIKANPSILELGFGCEVIDAYGEKWIILHRVGKKGGWKKKQPIYQKKYLSEHPWARNWTFSKGRAKRKNWEHTLSVENFRKLWIRDKAHLLKAPSIDRINPRKGYIKGNCRFIERSLNSSLGNKGINKIKVCPNCGWRNEPK